MKNATFTKRKRKKKTIFLVKFSHVICKANRYPTKILSQGGSSIFFLYMSSIYKGVNQPTQILKYWVKGFCCTYKSPGGYSDLSWTGVCHSSLKTHTHLKGWFWPKRVPIFKDFPSKIGLFFKNSAIFGVFAMRKPRKSRNLGLSQKSWPMFKDFLG